MRQFRFFLTSFIFVSFYISTSDSLSSSSRGSKPRIPVLQYHDEWACVDKPCGLTAHRSKSTPKHKSVLTTRVKRQLARKVFPVHRLDHRTSGAILLAFNSSTAGRLHEAAIRRGKKQYIALVRGEWNRNETTIIVDKPLRVKGNITKEAITKFSLLAATPGTEEGDRGSSLLLCEPVTGRTHQIRRHAYFMGQPIIGDSQHGDSRVNRWFRENKSLDRLALHCWKLEFHMDGQHHECIAPLPKEIQHLLQTTNLWNDAVAKENQLKMEPFDNRGGTFGRDYQRRRKDSEDASRQRD